MDEGKPLADGGVARDLWEKVLVQAAAAAPSPATALAEACHRVRALGRGLHSSTFQLNLSCF